MEEKLEYRFRGLGVLMLCMLLFAAGIWRFGEGAVPAGSAAVQGERGICYVQMAGKDAALSFTADGEQKELEMAMEGLKKAGVSAVFFLPQTWIKNNPEAAASIQENGHKLLPVHELSDWKDALR